MGCVFWIPSTCSPFLSGSSVFANGGQLSQSEISTICQGFDNNDAVYGSGLRIGGQKYFTIRADDRVIQGRKVHSLSDSGLIVKGDEGVVCTRTKQAVLVAHYPAGQQAGEVTKVVLSLGDYLINLGY